MQKMDNNPKTKIFISDDHPLFRDGLKTTIAACKEFELIGESGNGKETLEFIIANQPEIAILDIELPDVSGIEIAKNIHEKNIPVKIVFLTLHRDRLLLENALKYGASGYLLKENSSEEIINCLKEVRNGNFYLSTYLSNIVVNKISAGNFENEKLQLLTNSEKKILKLISANKTSAQIADELHISIKTVENHRKNICDKLDLHGSHTLLKFALENKNYFL